MKHTAEEVRTNIAANRRHMTSETELQLTAYADMIERAQAVNDDFEDAYLVAFDAYRKACTTEAKAWLCPNGLRAALLTMWTTTKPQETDSKLVGGIEADESAVPVAYIESYRLAGETHQELTWETARDDREYSPPFTRPPAQADRDAYEGARRDLLDWKHRALSAESILRSLGYKGLVANEPPAQAAQVDKYRALCAAVYQADGAYDLPVRFLDALIDAANGHIENRQPTDSLLPCYTPTAEPVAQGEAWSRHMADLEAGQYVGAGAHGIPNTPTQPHSPDADSGQVTGGVRKTIEQIKSLSGIHLRAGTAAMDCLFKLAVAHGANESAAAVIAHDANGEMNELQSCVYNLAALAAQGHGEAMAYFSADPAEGEFSTHESLAEAVAGAESLLAFAQDVASDAGWVDEPPKICYGVVLGGCVEKEGSRRPAAEGSDFAEMVDFRLTEQASIPPASPAGVPDAIANELRMATREIEMLRARHLVPDGWTLRETNGGIVMKHARWGNYAVWSQVDKPFFEFLNDLLAAAPQPEVKS